MTTPDSDTMTTPDSDIMTIPDLDITSTIGLKHADPQFDIPRLGFGVYRSPADVCRASCLEALRCGYRYIDTAQYYENEVQVGEAVRESGIPRDQIFISTKILFRCGSVEKTLERCRQSVKDIGLGCIDLFLIHSPSSGAEGREEMWRALEILKKEGGARAIGVSN